jgi:nucleoside-diphosphate-sugar epimerase
MSDARIYLAGHDGMVGSAMLRILKARGHTNLLFRPLAELDLTEQGRVREFFRAEKPEFVLLAAARVGGIGANSRFPAEFIYQNLMIEANVIHAAYEAGVNRLLLLGSSCIYPRMATQPMKEDELLTGPLEPTNEPYAVAKIAGIKLCESYNRQYGTDFRSVMPTNLYGPHDNFHRENSHVVPAMIRKFHDAKIAGKDSVTVWGSGRPLREFLHVDDMAAASLHVMDLDRAVWESAVRPMMSHINVGSGIEVSIADLAEQVRTVVGFSGRIEYDASQPDGTPRKLLDSSLLEGLGWKPEISLAEGLESAYSWFLEHHGDD